MIRSIGASLAALGLAAGLAAPAVSAEPSQSIRVIGVDGYMVIDREHVVLDGIGQRHYLVTLRRSCPSLTGGMRIATSFPATGTVFNPRLEYLVTGDRRTGERCYIDTIEHVESRDAARALVEERRQAEAAPDAVGE